MHLLQSLAISIHCEFLSHSYISKYPDTLLAFKVCYLQFAIYCIYDFYITASGYKSFRISQSTIMKFSILLSLTAVFSITLAAPSPRLQRRLERREASHAGRFSNRVETSSKLKFDNHAHKKNKTAKITPSTATQYSSNWAGAVLTTPPTDETYNFVTGTFTVPTPSLPSGVSIMGDGTWSASAWVGIDGDTCTSAILQTGIDFSISQSGIASYAAWYEWYPDAADDFDIAIAAGDVITAYVQTSTLTAGVAVIENKTTGQTASIDLNSTSSLCGTNAEWIVEDFEVNGKLVSLADFGSVTFTGAQATTDEGSSVGVNGATVFGIESSGVVYTSTSLESKSEIMVTYV